MIGKEIEYSFSPGLTLRGVVLYVFERNDDGSPESVVVERRGLGGRGGPVTVKVNEIVYVEEIEGESHVLY